MAVQLPIDRSVVVTLTREDKFPAARNFNIALLLTPTAISGVLDAVNRTYLYSGMDEVATHWNASSSTYKAAQRFFQAQVRPPQLKMGYASPTSMIADELDAIWDYDTGWFWGMHGPDLNDNVKQRFIADWAETKPVIFGLDSNNTNTESPGAVSDATFAATISQASPAVVTKSSHGLSNGDPVLLTTNGTLPAPLVIGTTYYVVNADTNTFNLATTATGSAINTTTAGSGTHTVTAPRYGGSIAEYVESKAYDHSSVFYHTDPQQFLTAGAWGYTCGRDLDRAQYKLAQAGRVDSGQAYTLKFKTFPGVEPVDKRSAIVQAITGFIPGLGSDRAQGHRANTYINQGGVNICVEGTVGSGAFVDEIHSNEWMKSRVQEGAFGYLLNVPRAPMTNQGVASFIEGGINPPLRRAFAAGIIAPREGDDGLFLPAFEVSVDDVANTTEAQRRNRIAPDIKVVFRPAGAIHFASITMVLRY